MAGGPIEDADPVPVVLRHLKADQEVIGAFGGPAHVSGAFEAPWPHLRVSPGLGGDVGTLQWLASPDVRLECWGDPQGRISSPKVRRLLLLAARVVAALPDVQTRPGDPVISRVRPSGGLAQPPTSTGQAKWEVALNVTIRPPDPTPGR